MAYCTGRCMADPQVGGVFDAPAVTAMVEKVFVGRVQFHDGDEEIAPGISFAQGRWSHARHADCARRDRAGRVVLGSDTAHFTPTSNLAGRFRSSTACRCTPKRSARRCGWPALRSTSFRGTIRWCSLAIRAHERDWRVSCASTWRHRVEVPP